MTRLPRLTGLEVIAALAKAGFQVVRVRGSHHFVRHPDGRTTVIPSHSGEILGRHVQIERGQRRGEGRG